MKYKRILCISDLHFPYHHIDTFNFLKALKKKYKFDKIIQGGDEVDNHAISFHDTHPDLLSPGDELELAKKHIKKLGEIFPKMSIIDSNHGSLPYRKMVHHGLPLKYLKSYKEVLDAPLGWHWSNDLVVTCSNNKQVYFHHGKSSSQMKLSKNMGMSVVQFHYHSKFEISYWANPKDLYFEMRCGCLIDDGSLALEYNKTTIERPIIGCGAVLDGIPRLLPMLLLKGGRWSGFVP